MIGVGGGSVEYHTNTELYGIKRTAPSSFSTGDWCRDEHDLELGELPKS
jgi:hypothetical protein